MSSVRMSTTFMSRRKTFMLYAYAACSDSVICFVPGGGSAGSGATSLRLKRR